MHPTPRSWRILFWILSIIAILKVLLFWSGSIMFIIIYAGWFLWIATLGILVFIWQLYRVTYIGSVTWRDLILKTIAVVIILGIIGTASQAIVWTGFWSWSGVMDIGYDTSTQR